MYVSMVYCPLFKSVTKLHIYIRYKLSIVCSCFCHRCDGGVSAHTNHVFLFRREAWVTPGRCAVLLYFSATKAETNKLAGNIFLCLLSRHIS